MSASSHTRGHRYAPELHGRGARVARSRTAARRSTTGARCNSRSARSRNTRRSHATAFARRARSPPSAGEHIVEAARALQRPVHHQAQPRGQGPGRAAVPGASTRLQRYVDSDAFEDSVDGITLIQEYIQAPEPLHHARRVRRRQVPLRGARRHVARLRAVPRRRLPGRRCVLPGGRHGSRCGGAALSHRQRLLASRSSSATGVSSPTTASASRESSSSPMPRGEIYTYDVNTNTNYNPDAEARPASSGCARSPRISETSCTRSTAVRCASARPRNPRSRGPRRACGRPTHRNSEPAPRDGNPREDNDCLQIGDSHGQRNGKSSS